MKDLQRPFLKWAGNKYRLTERIKALLPDGNCLIEPFTGSGAVFLNTDFKRYILNDINPDLIALFQIVQTSGQEFFDYAKKLFTAKNNQETRYYELRQRFNASDDSIERSALFIYLNRHGYNGLCRYNKGKREFNVPFGRYVKPRFPEPELQFFHSKAKHARFICEEFNKTMSRARKGSVVYCDPPYAPLSKTANFTSYSHKRFEETEQRLLADKAAQLADRQIPVLISNHDTPFTRNIYQNTQLNTFPVRRTISCNPKNRGMAAELLAFFPATP